MNIFRDRTKPMTDAERKLAHFVACSHCGEASSVRRGTTTFGRVLCERCKRAGGGIR